MIMVQLYKIKHIKTFNETEIRKKNPMTHFHFSNSIEVWFKFHLYTHEFLTVCSNEQIFPEPCKLLYICSIIEVVCLSVTRYDLN